MSVSEAFSVRLFVVLTALALADAENSTTGTSYDLKNTVVRMTTRDTKQHITETSSHKARLQQTTSTPVQMTTRDTKQHITETSSHKARLQQTTSTPESPMTAETKNPIANVTLTKHQLNVTAEHSKSEKNIIVEKPTDLDLKCSLPLNPSLKIEIIDVVWAFNNKTIREHNITRNEVKSSWCTWHTVQVRNKDKMGNYTCSFKTGNKLHGYGAFHVKVPEIQENSKQTVSYVGDAVTLTCKTGNYTPLYWGWYTKNGSEEVAINETLMPEKYKVSQKYTNDTKLKVHNLSEKDDGIYWCKVVFELGESHRSGSLKVLTYMAPLKPFLGIVAEVLLLVALIFTFEVCSKKKQTPTEVVKEFDQIEQLKSEDSNGVENSFTRHRKV